MTPNASTIATNPFADPKPLKWYQRPLENTIMSTIGLILAAWVCGMFYMNGKEKGRHQALREVSRIAEDHALLTEYLRQRGH